MIGKAVRLRRLFRSDEKTVISALDFGGFMGPVPGLENPKGIVTKVVSAGVDAIIANPGFARDTYEIWAGKAALILRITGGCSRFSPDPSYHVMISSIEEAIRLGADAVCLMVIVGAKEEHKMLAQLGEAVIAGQRYGLPVVAELLPDFEHSFDPDWVGVCARVGFEIGADLIKTYYCGPEFKSVVENCPVPIVMAGGPKSTDFLTNIQDALGAGAAGVAIGRNIFQAPDPFAQAREIISLVHG